jgi:hypothetical protein
MFASPDAVEEMGDAPFVRRGARSFLMSDAIGGYFDGGLLPRPPPEGLPVVLGQLPPLPPLPPFPPPFPPPLLLAMMGSCLGMG